MEVMNEQTQFQWAFLFDVWSKREHILAQEEQAVVVNDVELQIFVILLLLSCCEKLWKVEVCENYVVSNNFSVTIEYCHYNSYFN